MSPRRVGSVVALIVLLADQAAKYAVLFGDPGGGDGSTPILPFLNLALRWNSGISFSLFAQDSAAGRLILLGVTGAALALLLLWLSNCHAKLAAVGLGAIIGGALGNALDRLIHGAVIDYLDLHVFGRHLFVFNLADAAINIGVALLVTDLVFRPGDAEQARQHGGK